MVLPFFIPLRATVARSPLLYFSCSGCFSSVKMPSRSPSAKLFRSITSSFVWVYLQSRVIPRFDPRTMASRRCVCRRHDEAHDRMTVFVDRHMPNNPGFCRDARLAEILRRLRIALRFRLLFPPRRFCLSTATASRIMRAAHANGFRLVFNWPAHKTYISMPQ
jgi:hypothetical protein